MVGVAVVGAGYWGPNLIRNFAACPGCRLVAVCDRDAARLAKVLAPYPAVAAIADYDDLLQRVDVDAVVIATPVHTHGPLGLQALRAGKHVLIEKPLALSVSQAEGLVSEAETSGLTLMTDHTFIYSSAVRKMKELIDAGALGDIYYVDSVRINLGLFQNDINVLWDLAPHDLSIVDYLLGRTPLSVSAFGACHAHTHWEIEDVAYLNLDYGRDLLASFHVNWLSPVKVRQFIIGGSKKSIVYNELDLAEKVKVYDRGITCSSDLAKCKGLQVEYRMGDVWCPHLENIEPLQTMVRHFIDCIKAGKRPVTDGASGLRVVRILELAQRSIKAQGARLVFKDSLRLVA